MGAVYTDSFLTRLVADVRMFADEPSVNAKYTDARIIELLYQNYPDIINELNRNRQQPITATYLVTINGVSTVYILPPIVGSILAVYQASTSGNRYFYDSRSNYNVMGRGIWIEGLSLKLQCADYISSGTIITINYLPVGTAKLHEGTCTINAGATIATLGATPNAGTLDTRPNVYVGAIFRLLNADGTNNVVQDRVITAYDVSTRAATLEAALVPVPTGTLTYEICPSISRGLDSVISLYVAYIIHSIEGNEKRMGSLYRLFSTKMRDLRLSGFYANLQEAAHVTHDTYKNRRFAPLS